MFGQPDPELLVSKDKMITIPANVTSLIQPMDQGVLQALKLRCRKKLLQKLLIEDDMGVNIVDFVKSIHMLQVSPLVAEAWEEIPQSTFRKSWQKILPTSGLSKTQIVAMANAYSEVKNKFDVLLTLLSAYYVFSICYPKGCHNFFSFLEIKVLGITPKKITSTVSHFLARV